MGKRSRSRSRGDDKKDKDKDRKKEKDKDREREKDKDKKDKSKRDKERSRTREKARDRSRDREKDKAKDKDKDRRDKDRDKGRDKERSRDRDRDKGKDKSKKKRDRSSSARSRSKSEDARSASSSESEAPAPDTAIGQQRPIVVIAPLTVGGKFPQPPKLELYSINSESGVLGVPIKVASWPPVREPEQQKAAKKRGSSSSSSAKPVRKRRLGRGGFDVAEPVAAVPNPFELQSMALAAAQMRGAALAPQTGVLGPMQGQPMGTMASMRMGPGGRGPGATSPCFNFMSGKCFRPNCRFLHIGPGTRGVAISPQPPPMAFTGIMPS